MKIRYMKDKAERYLNLKYEEISIHYIYIYIYYIYIYIYIYIY